MARFEGAKLADVPAPGWTLCRLFKPALQVMRMATMAAALAPHIQTTHRQLADAAPSSGGTVLGRRRAATTNVDCGRALVELLYVLVLALFDRLVGVSEELKLAQELHVPQRPTSHELPRCELRSDWRERTGHGNARLCIAALGVVLQQRIDDRQHALDERHA